MYVNLGLSLCRYGNTVHTVISRSIIPLIPNINACSRPGQIVELEAGATWTHHYPLELPRQLSLRDVNASAFAKLTGKPPKKCAELATQCNDFKTRMGPGRWLLRDLCQVTCKVSPWILVRSSRYAELPPLGTRVGPEHAHLMPKIVTDASTPALGTQFRSHHYYIHGVEVAVAPNVRENFGLIRLGTDGCSSCRHGNFFPSSVDQLPHHIVFDQASVLACMRPASWVNPCEKVPVFANN